MEGVSAAPVWSPDGKWIAYTKAPMRDRDGDGTADKKDEREGWIAPDAVSRTLDAKRFDGRVVTSTRYKSNGTLTWMPQGGRSESLFAATGSTGASSEALTALLIHARRSISYPPYFTMDYTAGEMVDAIRASGFTPRRTLLWLRV